MTLNYVETVSFPKDPTDDLIMIKIEKPEGNWSLQSLFNNLRRLLKSPRVQIGLAAVALPIICYFGYKHFSSYFTSTAKRLWSGKSGLEVKVKPKEKKEEKEKEKEVYDERTLYMLGRIMSKYFGTSQKVDTLTLKSGVTEEEFLENLIDQIHVMFYPSFGIDSSSPIGGGAVVPDGLSNHLTMALVAQSELRKIPSAKPFITYSDMITNVEENSTYLVHQEDEVLQPDSQTEYIKKWEENYLTDMLNKYFENEAMQHDKVENFINFQVKELFNHVYTNSEMYRSTPRTDRTQFHKYLKLTSHLILLHAMKVKKVNPEDTTLEKNDELGRQFVLNHLSDQVVESLFADERVIQLFEGVSGGAFHPLIMLSYGLIQNRLASTVTNSLAYWMYAFQSLAPNDVASSLIKGAPKLEDQIPHDLKLQMTLKKIEELYPIYFSKEWRENALKDCNFMINLRMKAIKEAMSPDDYKELCNYFFDLNQKPRFDLEDFSHVAMNMYLYGPEHLEFTTLHCVTGCHAARVVNQYVKTELARDKFLYHLWESFLCIYVMTGGSATFTPHHEYDPVPSWHQIFKALSKNYDEHDLKFTYSCHEESQVYSKRESLYRKCAAKRVGLLGKGARAQ